MRQHAAILGLEALAAGHPARELEHLRGEQRRSIETEARLRWEIEAIGDDRRKLNQQLIDTAARIRKGPAPLNLQVPEYQFVSDTVVQIG